MLCSGKRSAVSVWRNSQPTCNAKGALKAQAVGQLLGDAVWEASLLREVSASELRWFVLYTRSSLSKFSDPRGADLSFPSLSGVMRNFFV